MKRIVPILAVFGILIVIAAGMIGFPVIEQYLPTKEHADLDEAYHVNGDETAILYNYELQEQKGIYENGQTYLPVSWVNDCINERFYWDQTENLLVYALPDQIVYADEDTKGSNGAPLILVKENEVYLTLGLIANYTDVQIQTFDTGEGRRVLISDWGTRETARVKRSGGLRIKGGVKSMILTDLAKDDTVTVLESMDKWSRVVSSDGNVGYVENRRLSEPESQKFSGNFEAPVYKNTSVSGKIVLGWHQVTTLDGNKTFDSVVSKTKGLNVISPTWFSLTDNNGNYRSLASSDYVSKAHAKGIQVWALIDNFSENIQTETLLSSTSTRRKLINSLIADAEKYHLDGINLDFESLKKEAGVHYIEFIRELSIPCRQKGIILSVDNYVPARYNSFYDLKEQGIVADYVIMMGYDEHYAGGDPGSVSSISYVKNGIAGMLEDVPKEKVINGVPFYTRLWTEAANGTVTSRALGISEAKKWVENNKVELSWQPDEAQYYGELQTNDGKQFLWMEEERSLKEKMNLVRQNDLAGVACWKLGFEDSAAWDSIQWN